MTWLDAIRIGIDAIGSGVAEPREETQHIASVPTRTRPRGLGGRRLRLSHDTEQSVFQSALAVTAPLSADDRWRTEDLDTSTLDRVSPARLLELLADVSPDISRGLWDFLRMCNPGWTADAMRLSGNGKAPQATQAALTAFLDRLKARHGSFDILIGRLYTGAFLRGSLFAELILDKQGRTPLDIATPDPASARFDQLDDPDLGQIWRLYQWQNGKKVALDRETIRYVPIDPLFGSPYGRAIAAPALFSTLFAIALLHDLRRVVAQQGYPRLDLEVQLEQLLKAMPGELEDDPEAFKAWVDAVIEEVSVAYSALEPDDAYVHTDVVKVNGLSGALGVGTGSLQAANSLIEALERQAVRALKTMPLLFGVSDGVSEANANRQWEIFVAGIKAIQHLCEGLLEHLLTIAMQAQGYACTVKFRFAELRAAEMMRDAQTEKLQIQNARARYDHGWISQDEAAQQGAGKEKADAPTPRSSGGAQSASDLQDIQPDPGSDR